MPHGICAMQAITAARRKAMRTVVRQVHWPMASLQSPSLGPTSGFNGPRVLITQRVVALAAASRRPPARLHGVPFKQALQKHSRL